MMKKTIFILMAMLFVSGIAMSQNKASINISKKAVNVTSQVDEVSSQTLMISNQGDADLNLTIAAVETSSTVNQGTVTMSNEQGDAAGSEINYLLSRVESGSQVASWLSLSQSTASVSPSGNTQLKLDFDAQGLDAGIYTARILLSSNDQENAYEIVPITMIVGDGSRASTVITTTDNENNALTGVADGDMDNYLCSGTAIGTPIEFNIFVTETPVTSAQLSIYAFDVDETSGEIDPVHFNGTFIGNLTGNNQTWNTSVFNLPAGLVNSGAGAAGKNLITIGIASSWCVEIDWGQMIINGGTAGNAFLRYVNIDKTCYLPGENVAVDIEVDTDIPSQTIRVETNLLDENMIAVDGSVSIYPISLVADEPLAVNLTVPGGATLGSTYNVQVIVYDDVTNIQQDIHLEPMLVNNPCTQPVPVSNWAIILGVFLIGAFMVVRYRRRLA